MDGRASDEGEARDSGIFTGGGESRRAAEGPGRSATSLGKCTAEWPSSLKTTVSTIRTRGTLMFLWWGLELIRVLQRR